MKFVLVKSVFPYDIVLSPLLAQLSLFLYKTLAIYFALKSISADAILLSKYKKNRPENAFQEVVSTREVYGEKWRIFRVLWETPESRIGSFAGRFPGPRSFRVFWETHAWSRTQIHICGNLTSQIRTGPVKNWKKPSTLEHKHDEHEDVEN